MTIWVDADGCPVVKETIKLAKDNKLEVICVKNHAVSINDDYAKVVTVDMGSDLADYYIVNHMIGGDFVITQDNGLAAMVLAKNGIPVSINGVEITSETIDILLASRHTNKMNRRQGKRGTKFKKRTSEDNQKFFHRFHLILEKYLS